MTDEGEERGGRREEGGVRSERMDDGGVLGCKVWCVKQGLRRDCDRCFDCATTEWDKEKG
jgi:hypothetical protein